MQVLRPYIEVSGGAGRELGSVSEQALVRTASWRTPEGDDVIGGHAPQGGARSATPRKLRCVRAATLPVLVALGAVLAAGAVAGWLWPSGPTFVTVNFLVGLSAVAMLGVQQAFIHHAPAGQRAQVNSTMVASVGVLEGAGAVLAGGVAAAVSVPVAYLLIGGLVLGMSLTALRAVAAAAASLSTRTEAAALVGLDKKRIDDAT